MAAVNKTPYTPRRSRHSSIMDRLAHMLAAAISALLLLTPVIAPARPSATVTRRDGESTEQALYRHGVRCMEVIERAKCAIDYFERLLDEKPTDRSLAGDAVLRLVALYRADQRDDDAKELLRDFWDIGMGGRRGRRVVPYSTRYLPRDMSMLLYVDMQSTARARVFTRLPDEAKDLMFTCDEARRERLEQAQRDRRERKRRERAASSAAKSGKTVSAGPRRSDSDRSDQGSKSGTKKDDPTLMEDGLCQLARALGHDDLRAWDGFLTAQNHTHPNLSAIVARVPKAKATVRRAVQGGTLKPVGPRRWRIVGETFGGEPLEVYNLDGDELVLAAASQLARVEKARKSRTKTLDRELQSLVRRVPEDVSFLAVMTKRAMQDQVRQLGALASFLPAPEGMLISAVAYDYAGVFVQIPTSDPLRAALLLSIVRNMLESEERKDDADERPVRPRDVDVSRTRDGKALQMSLVLDSAQVRRMFVD